MTAPVDVHIDEVAGRPARGAAWFAIAAVAVGLVLAPPGLGTAGFQGVGEVVDGELEALRAGVWTPLPDGAEVRRDEPLRTGVSMARLRVRGGQLSVAPGSRLTLGRDTTELAGGAVLFEGDAVRMVELGAVEVRGRGAFRVDVHPSSRVAVYRGGVAVSDGSGQRSVASYEQVELTEGRTRDPVALRYVPEDPWDARLLAAAIAVDQQVERTAASLRAVYGIQLQRPAFYEDFIAIDDVLASALPELSPIARRGAFGPPAETLIAVIVTRLLVERAGFAVDEATETISAQRRAGATWGLVLRRHDLRADDLRAAADTALRSRAIAVEEGRAAPVEDDGGSGAGGEPGGGLPDDAPPADEPPGSQDPDGPGQDPPADDDGDGDGDTDDGGGDDGDDGGGGDDGDDGDDGGTVDEIEDTVDDLIDELPLPVMPPGLSHVTDRPGDRRSATADAPGREQERGDGTDGPSGHGRGG